MEVPEGVKITRDDITAYRWTSETGDTGDPGRVARDALILEQDLEVGADGGLLGRHWTTPRGILGVSHD